MLCSKTIWNLMCVGFQRRLSRLIRSLSVGNAWKNDKKWEEISCFFVFEKQDLTPKKNFHGKNQRVSKKQRSNNKELTFSIRNNLVD